MDGAQSQTSLHFDTAPDERRPLVGTMQAASEESFLRRTQTLLRSAPVHRLAELARYQPWNGTSYDPRVLALAAIDAVVARQGLSSGVTYDELVTALADLVRQAEPDAGDEEHVAVAAFVVDGLLNDRDNNDATQFSIPYGDYRQRYVLRALPFWLLSERQRDDGIVIVEASADAINAFRGGLDLDVTDAQMAQVLVLKAQIERGDLDEAEITAENNVRLTLELDARIRQLMDATRADLGNVDWSQYVLEQLDRARRHVADRTQDEEALLAHLARNDNLPPDGHVAKPVERVAQLLEQCLRHHRNLHVRLMNAPSVFLEEQHRQQLRVRISGVARIDVRTQLLDPYLQLPESLAAHVAETFLCSSLGVKVPRLPRLVDLIDRMLAERKSASTDDEEDIIEFDSIVDEEETIDGEVLAQAGDVLRACFTTPVPLSTLMEQAAERSIEVQEVVRLSALWCYAPENEDEDDTMNVISDLLPPTIVAVAAGHELDVGRWRGDDLIIGPAAMLLDELEIDELEIDELEIDENEIDENEDDDDKVTT